MVFKLTLSTNCNYHFSQADTGTSLHLDPDYTVAWNTVLSGVKLWSVLPLDMIPVSPDQFSCQPSCSQVREGEISIESWFSNILPQLMNRSWYGRKPIRIDSVMTTVMGLFAPARA